MSRSTSANEENRASPPESDVAVEGIARSESDEESIARGWILKQGGYFVLKPNNGSTQHWFRLPVLRFKPGDSVNKLWRNFNRLVSTKSIGSMIGTVTGSVTSGMYFFLRSFKKLDYQGLLSNLSQLGIGVLRRLNGYETVALKEVANLSDSAMNRVASFLRRA